MNTTDITRSSDSLGLPLLGLSGAPLALASRSPRRRELLSRLDIPLLFVDVDVEEGDHRDGEPASAYVQRLAERKLDAAIETCAEAAYVVLAADTVVEVDGDILEKPVDERHALELLGRIEGRWHNVWTGLALQRVADRKRLVAAERTRVYFEIGDDRLREIYVKTGEPMDKAGAYGIQGWGGLFVPEIEGDYFNVMGLPLARLRALCAELEGNAGSRER